jgi:hypothetical protein
LPAAATLPVNAPSFSRLPGRKTPSCSAGASRKSHRCTTRGTGLLAARLSGLIVIRDGELPFPARRDTFGAHDARYDTLLFDLDGTLINSVKLILDSYHHPPGARHPRAERR